MTRGYGDRSRDASVEVIPSAVEQAVRFLESEHPETLQRADRVQSLIEGFETPFGLELLSTVHWVMKETPGAQDNLAETVSAVRGWNERKAEIFNAAQIELAWTQLKEKGWAQ